MRDRIADMVCLLRKKPRTRAELGERTGISRHSMRAWVVAFEAEGLVRRVRQPQTEQGRVADLWEWAA